MIDQAVRCWRYMLASQARENFIAVAVEGLDGDRYRAADQYLVWHDLSLQAGRLELLGNILRRRIVLRRTGDVRGRGQHSQVLARQLRIGDGEKLRIDSALACRPRSVLG